MAGTSRNVHLYYELTAPDVLIAYITFIMLSRALAAPK